MKRCPHCGRSLMAEQQEVSQLGLTPKQYELLKFLRTYMAEHDGVPPSFTIMCAGLGLSLKSKSTITRLLNGLEERGWIQRKRGRKHVLVLLDGGHDARSTGA